MSAGYYRPFSIWSCDGRTSRNTVARRSPQPMIPLADNAVDTVVMTWTLCSIPDPPAALHEMLRVLKPDGNLCFVEHGLSPEPGVERWQHRLTPPWRRIAGGCHLDRKMDDLIRQAGFDLTDLYEEYAPGPRAMSYMYQGCACRDHSRGIGPAD